MVATERQIGSGLTVRHCVHCGAAENLVRRMDYVGGLGYVPRLHCANERECWARWDEQHGFKPRQVA